jgi:RNA polymerase sigma-70 factor (ECF subfamily)
VPTDIERLYREHRAGLVRLVERELHDRHDAEDVVQTAFLDAQRALERGTTPHNPRAWLAAIALNAGRHLRRRRLNAKPLEEYAVQEASRAPEIHAALASLPREQRAAVVYRDVLGLSYGETAERMGKSVNAVTMLLHRARGQLRQTLGIAAGGVGLWHWLRRVGMAQATVVKSGAAVVAAAGLATTGVVAAHLVAPVGTGMTAAVPVARSGGLAEGVARARRSVSVLDSAPRHVGHAGGARVGAVPASTQRAGGGALSASVVSSTAAAAVSSSPWPRRHPAVSVPTLPILTSPVTVAAKVTVGTPITSLTVTLPMSATVTTPIATATLPIP